MPVGFIPVGTVYGSVPDEHLPYGVDTPHNLYGMELIPQQKNDGPVRPQKLVYKLLNMGNPLQIFAGYARIQTPPPNTLK